MDGEGIVFEGTCGLTRRLGGHAQAHRLLQSALGGAREFAPAELLADEYELGMSVGAAEVLRFVVPVLAEQSPAPGTPLASVLRECRLALNELLGDDEADEGLAA